MSHYLLAWNPKRWSWDEIDELSLKVEKGQSVTRRWSCGNSKRIKPGDRVFIICLGEEPRGIFASGIVIIGPYEDLHWDEQKRARGEPGLFIVHPRR